jgi:hypothetical protein
MTRFLSFFLISVFFVSSPFAEGAQASTSCPEGSLLDLDQIAQAFGVIREQRLLDGRSPREGTDINDYNATLFIERGGFVLFDLEGLHKISAIDVVTDDYDSPLLEWSVDGMSYQPIPLGNSKQLRSHIRQRWALDLALKVRYLRLRPNTERGSKAVAELRVFCRTPDGFPDSPRLQKVAPFKAEAEFLLDRNKVLNFAYFALALAGAAAFFWMKRLDSKKRNALALLIVITGSAGWIRFGYFAGAGELLHPHEATHYYLGAKYFRELGYRELYRCISKSERENGRGFMIDRTQIRDLDNYTMHSGKLTRLDEGQCRAEFTAERWRQFKDDVDMLRRLFVRRHFHGILKDHGYNATPLHSVWLEKATNALPASRGSLKFFALLDIAMTFAAIALMWWGFGPVVASVAALTLGISDLSSYDWIGGSLGRSTWLMALCAGAACLKRGHSAVGTGLVTLAALLRLVPVVFVGAIGLYFLVRLIKSRQSDPEDRNILASIFVALAVGLLVPLIAFGPDVYPAFVSNMIVHAGNASINKIGLSTVLGAAGSPYWLNLAIRSAVLLLSIHFIVHVANLGRAPWSIMPLGGLLIFGALGLGYDYAWLIVLAPFAQASQLSGVALLGFVAATNLSSNMLPPRESFILLSVALIPILPIIVYFGHNAIGPVIPRNRGG